MDIVVYTAEDCPRCAEVKLKFTENNLEYIEREAEPYLQGEHLGDPDNVDLLVAFCKHDGELPIAKIDGKFYSYDETLEFLEWGPE